MKKTAFLVAVIASALCLMLGCIGVAFAENDPAYQGQQQGGGEQTSGYASNLYMRYMMSAEPQDFTPANHMQGEPLQAGTAVSFKIYAGNGESCKVSAYLAEIDDSTPESGTKLKNEEPYSSLSVTTTEPTAGKITVSFTMPTLPAKPEAEADKVLLLKVEKEAAPVTPTITAQGTYGVVAVTQDGKQLGSGGQFVAGKPIELTWTALYAEYEIDSMTNTVGKSNAPVRVEGTDTWVIQNPDTSAVINIRCTEVRKDGKIEVEKATGLTPDHAITMDASGSATSFFLPGETVYVKLVDMDGLKKSASDREWMISGQSQGGQRQGALTATETSDLYTFTVPSGISRSAKVMLNLSFESSDTENYLFKISGLEAGATAHVLVDGKVSAGIPRAQLNDGNKEISVVVTVQDGSKYTIGGTVSVKDAQGPYPSPISLSFVSAGADTYSANATVNSDHVRNGFIEISLDFTRTDSRHSVGDSDRGSGEKADFEVYIVESNDPSRVSEQPASYVLAGEKIRFVFDVPEGRFVSLFKPVCLYSTENYPVESALTCTKIDGNTYEVAFIGTGTDIAGSELQVTSKLSPCAVNIDTDGSTVDARNGKAALEASLQSVLTDLQNGKTPTGMSSEDATILVELAKDGLGSASIGLSAEDTELTAEESALIKKALGDKVVTGAVSFDLSANVQLISTGNDGSLNEEDAQLGESEGSQGQTVKVGGADLTALDEAVALTVPVDASIASSNTAMYRIHEGKVEKVEGAAVADGKVNFEADRFSTYFLVDASTVAGTEPTPGGTEDVKPGATGDASQSSAAATTQKSTVNTGDFTVVAVLGVAVVLAIAAGAAIVARRRSGRQ